MHSLISKDQVQLTHIFKQAIERFDENLDQVEEGERGFGGGGDKDEGEGGVGAVGDLRRSVAVRRTARIRGVVRCGGAA